MNIMKLKFAIIGAAGYIAPRHMKAIKEIGGELVAAYDKSDSVGVLDKWFPECGFIVNEQEMIDRCRWGVDYVVICTPNHRHVIDILKFADHTMCIVEKPLDLNMDHIDANQSYHQDPCWGHVNVILQLRLHPDVKIMRQVIDNSVSGLKCKLTYHTPRGKWYHSSWKGDIKKSGGILMNIGIHMFDLMIHLFGKPVKYFTSSLETENAVGWIGFENGTIVDYHLSTSTENKTCRHLQIGNYEHTFTGFEDLHTESYREIIAGRGFGVEDARPSIELVNKIRNGQGL